MNTDIIRGVFNSVFAIVPAVPLTLATYFVPEVKLQGTDVGFEIVDTLQSYRWLTSEVRCVQA